MNFNFAHQTLLEQMRISDAEIRRRLELAGLTDSCVTSLMQVAPIIDERVDSIVEQFYAAQLADDEIALLIGDADTLSRLKGAQRQYILDLFGGRYDGVYVNNRLRIGLVHKRIGVEPKLYLGAVRVLKQLLFSVLDISVTDAELRREAKSALDRLIYFDTTLVFDTYISSMLSEVDAAKKKVEEYANSLEQKVLERTAQLEALAKQDPLTGLYNQRAMRELFAREMASARRRHAPIAFAYLDIDDFKSINDDQGHLKGDEILKQVSEFIASSIRDVDIGCRYGGDEFCIVLPDSDSQGAAVICQRVAEALAIAQPEVSLSIGVSHTGPEQFVSEDRLIAKADQAMYQDKFSKRESESTD